MKKLNNILEGLMPMFLVVGFILMQFSKTSVIGGVMFLIGVIIVLIKLPIDFYYNYQEKTICFSKIKPDAIIPSKRNEDAGYDIYPCFEEDYMIIYSHQTEMIPTGIASAFNEKYYMQLEERGSTGTKGMGQRCGVIDSGFRNEWQVPITNHNSSTDICISKLSYDELIKKYPNDIELFDECKFYPYSKAVAQAVLLPVPKVMIKEKSYEDLLKIKSERGIGMLGSSGK